MGNREQEIKEIGKKLSKASDQQLVIALAKFANIAVQAQNTGAYISSDGGLELGHIIFEYLKRTDKTFKEMAKESGV